MQDCVRSITDRFHISESTFIKVIRKVTAALCEMANEIIKWPDDEGLQQVVDSFQHIN